MSSITTSNSNSIQNIQQQSKSRFPRLQECAHFHYEVSTVDLPKNFKCVLLSQNAQDLTQDLANLDSKSSSTSDWFQLQVTSNDKKWVVYRTLDNFRYLDKFLHDCIFDRKFSLLLELSTLTNSNSSSENLMISSTVSTLSKKSNSILKHLKQKLNDYVLRLNEILFVNPINCGPILNWFEIDNKGNRLLAIDDSPINIPGVAAALVIKRYVAQNLDEISLDVGNMISVIDMPPPEESFWWRGKKELEVGFFPSDCVELIKCNQHLSNNLNEHLPKQAQNQSVRLKHGKLITLLRSFFNTRPARNQLQSKGILKQRVFACDLGEHLSNSQQEVPKILRICTEFIEKFGIVDGIYRHTGLQSNIQKLRNAFDEEKFNEIEQEIYINDVHSVSSLLKMYFRELPNPLLTYQLYHKFISIAESLMRAVNVEDKIIEIHDVVQQLPPPHYRTLSFLMKHLHKLAEYSAETNMNTKNLAIVWAPNLLKSKEMDSKDCMQYDMLHSITLQANISEFLIANADTIFNDKFASLVRKQDGSVKSNLGSNNKTYRPISICYNNNKLLTLEEAQDKYKQVGPSEIPKYHTIIEIPENIKKKKSKDKDKDKDKDKKLNQQVHTIPTNIQIQQQFEFLQAGNASNSNALSSSPSSLNTGSSSPAFKSIFRNLRVGSMKQASPNANPVPTDPIDLLKPSTIVRTASTSTFKPPPSSTVGILSQNPAQTPLHEYMNDFNSCINQLQSGTVMNSTNNLSSFTGTLSSPNNPNQASFNRNSKSNQSQTSIKSNMSLNKPILSTFESKKSDMNNPIPSKRRTIQGPTVPGQQASLAESKSNNSINLSTFNRSNSINCDSNTNKLNSPSITSCSQLYNNENEYDELDPVQIVSPNLVATIQTPNNEDEMCKYVNYINKLDKENVENKKEEEEEEEEDEIEELNDVQDDDDENEKNSTLIQSIIEDEAGKLRLSSSSLSSSADSGLNDPEQLKTQKVDRRTYIINKIYDNMEDTNPSNDDQYEKVILKNKHQDENIYELDQYDNDLLVKTGSNNTELIINRANLESKQTKTEPIYMNLSQELIIRESTGFEVDNILKSETENFDTQLIELNNQIKELLNSNQEETEVVKKQNTESSPRPKSASVSFGTKNNEVKNRRVTISSIETNKTNLKSNSIDTCTLFNNNNTNQQITKSCSNEEILIDKTPTSNRASFRHLRNFKNSENLPEVNKIQPKSRQSLSINSKPFNDSENVVIIETKNAHEQENENDSNLTVKSKIKLIESIVASSGGKANKTSERSSSSSSSCSSSRSPPLSPKPQINKPPPLVALRTNVNKQVNTQENENIINNDAKPEHNEDDSSTRKITVKELLSKFEPK